MSALFSAPRALTVQSPAIPVLAGQPALVPLKLEGVEGINRLFEYKLVLQTPDALNYMGGTASNFDLESWVGLELTCSVELEGHGSFAVGVPGGSGVANQGAGVREISGLITRAQFIGEESRHALYEVTLRPWLHIATLNADCKVFQDKTVVEVIELVLSAYTVKASLTKRGKQKLLCLLNRWHKLKLLNQLKKRKWKDYLIIFGTGLIQHQQTWFEAKMAKELRWL